MNQLYGSFEDLVKSHDALFRPHRTSGALNVCRGVWEAREPEVQSLKEQLSSLKTVYDQLDHEHQALQLEIKNLKIKRQSEIESSNKELASLQAKLEATTASLNDVEALAETSQRELSRLQKYENSLDSVQRSQYREIEALKKRFAAESSLRAELEKALEQTRVTNERAQLEIMSKDDLIMRQQARIEEHEGRAKQQQRLNARMGVELDRFARENEQLTRAINQ